MILKKKTNARGLTLLEIIVYVAIFGIIAVIIANFLIQVVTAYAISRSEQEVLSNGRLLLETVSKSISEAEAIYTPTSVFNSDTGQLSLITKTDAQPEHQTAYADYWIDTGVFRMRKEGGADQSISSASVRIARFRLERISQGLGRDAVRITLEVDYAHPRYPASITLTHTVALRGNY